MGMAASQARLLTLTSRLHDIELKAQNLESQKLALATQQDELYQNYCEALDATTIQVAFMNGASYSYQDANFTNLCTYSDYRKKQYALRDNSTGNLIVTKEVKDAYDTYGNDKYTFAWAMLGMTDFGGLNYEHWTKNDESGAFIGYTGGRNSNADYEYTGYKYESWHLRYVGKTLAEKLYNNGNWLTIEEYYGLTSSY